MQKFQITVIGFAFAAILLIPTTTESSYGQSAPSGTITASTLNIGEHGTKNGGDCSQVGTWVETTLGPEGGTCTLSADIQITGNGVGLNLASSRVMLDGTGHTIMGSQTSSSNHIGVKTCNQCHTMGVKNLTIKNFGWGIASNYATGLIVTGTTIENVGSYAIKFFGVDGLKFESNNISVLGLYNYFINTELLRLDYQTLKK